MRQGKRKVVKHMQANKSAKTATCSQIKENKGKHVKIILHPE